MSLLLYSNWTLWQFLLGNNFFKVQNILIVFLTFDDHIFDILIKLLNLLLIHHLCRHELCLLHAHGLQLRADLFDHLVLVS